MRLSRCLKLAVSVALLAHLFVAQAFAQVTASEVPKEVKNIGIDEKLNQPVDVNLTFLDEEGRTVALKDLMHPDRPVVLNLAYYSCPLLCGFVLQGVVKSLRGVPYTPGVDIEVITVSFDTREKPELAKAKKANLLKEYGRPEAATGWHLLVDKDGNAKRLADQVGFKYQWNEADQDFAHASVTMILTPDGKVSRYLYGLDYEPRTLRLALTEASQGKIGSTVDRLLLFCYHYDPQARSYVPFARNVMKLGGVLVVIVLGAFLFWFWRREMKGQGGNRNVWPDESNPSA